MEALNKNEFLHLLVAFVIGITFGVGVLISLIKTEDPPIIVIKKKSKEEKIL